MFPKIAGMSVPVADWKGFLGFSDENVYKTKVTIKYAALKNVGLK